MNLLRNNMQFYIAGTRDRSILLALGILKCLSFFLRDHRHFSMSRTRHRNRIANTIETLPFCGTELRSFLEFESQAFRFSYSGNEKSRENRRVAPHPASLPAGRRDTSLWNCIERKGIFAERRIVKIIESRIVERTVKLWSTHKQAIHWLVAC